MVEEKGDIAASQTRHVVRVPWSPGQEIDTVLISKNSLLRMGLKHLLVGTCFAVSDAGFDAALPLPCHPASAPTLFIVDAGHSIDQVIETVGRLRTHRPEARVVIVADQFDIGFVRAACGQGVNAFCLTTSAREVLIRSLELTMLGETVLPSSMVLAMLREMAGRPACLSNDVIAGKGTAAPDPNVRRLSAREAEILHCLKEGAPNKIIARKLDVAEATVKVHVKAILRKVGAANRTQAAIWATEHLHGASETSLQA